MKVGDKDRKVPFKIPKGTTLPGYQGQLEISSQTSGQPYDLIANVTTDTSSFESSNNESCISGYIPTQRCITTPPQRSCITTPAHQDCDGPGRGGPGRGGRDGRPGPGGPGAGSCRMIPERVECVSRPPITSCHIEQVPVYGSHLVTYNNVTSVKHVVVDVVVPQGAHVGQFNHSSTNTTRSPINSTPCY